MLRGEIATIGGRAALLSLFVTVATSSAAIPSPPAPSLSSFVHSLEAPIPRPILDLAVTAGTTVELRWPALPPDIDEFELLLSVDDGISYPVRLTPQLEPGATSLMWVVPNLPTDAARLRLRVGRESSEVEGEPSGAFQILPREGLRPVTLWFVAGEWWTSVAASRTPVELTCRADTVAPTAIVDAEPSPAVPPASPELPQPSITVATLSPRPNGEPISTSPSRPASSARARPRRE